MSNNNNNNNTNHQDKAARKKRVELATIELGRVISFAEHAAGQGTTPCEIVRLLRSTGLSRDEAITVWRIGAGSVV